MTNLTGNARAEPRQRFARRGGRPQPAPDEDDLHRERSRGRGVHARDETVVYGRYAAIGGTGALVGLALGGTIARSSWTSQQRTERRLNLAALSLMV